MASHEEIFPKRTAVFEEPLNTSTIKKKSPRTITVQGKVNLPRRSAHRRQLETFLASAAINGGSIQYREPPLDGMFSTILKYANVHEISKFISQGKLKKYVVNNRQIHEYESSYSIQGWGLGR